MAASRFNHLTDGALVAALAASTLLAGCGQHQVAPVEQASAPVVRPDALAGAPTPPPAYAPPPVDAAPVPPPYAPPPPDARPGDRDVIYDLGPVVRPRDTMAPIPNPPEYGRRAPYDRYAAPHRRAPAARTKPHPRSARVHVHLANGAATSHAAGPVVAGSHAAASRPKPGPAARPPAPAAATPAAPVREAVPLVAKPASHAAAAAKPGVTATTGTPASAEQAGKLAAMQTALKDAVARTAVLNVPDLKPDQPTDVTLTLPADFASAVRDEAGKQGLQDAAASVNVTALLAGDGYAVAPNETQSQPLTVGQPTEFHWTVTAQQGAKGPLHADVGADLLGGGDQALQLGSVVPAGKGGLHISPRAWGAGLLVLLAVAVFAWFSRRGGAAAARRRRNSLHTGERPFDMADRGPPPPPPEERGF